MPNKLKDLLRKKLSKRELNLIPSSFDMIGNIIIFSDFPKELIKKEKIIGNEILKNYKNIRSIFKKTKKVNGILSILIRPGLSIEIWNFLKIIITNYSYRYYEEI